MKVSLFAATIVLPVCLAQYSAAPFEQAYNPATYVAPFATGKGWPQAYKKASDLVAQMT